MNRNDFQGRSLKVEFAKGKSNRYEQRGSFRGRGGYGYDRGDRGGYRGSRPEGGRFGDNFGDRGDRPPRGEAKCFNCQGTGHFIKDCPKRKDFQLKQQNKEDIDLGAVTVIVTEILAEEIATEIEITEVETVMMTEKGIVVVEAVQAQVTVETEGDAVTEMTIDRSWF